MLIISFFALPTGIEPVSIRFNRPMHFTMIAKAEYNVTFKLHCCMIIHSMILKSVVIE